MSTTYSTMRHIMMDNGKMGFPMDRENLSMMTVQCTRAVLSKDMPTVNRPYTSTRQGHFIEVKSSRIKLTAKDRFPHTSSTTRVTGSTTYPTARVGKFMAKIPTMTAILSKVKNRV